MRNLTMKTRLIISIAVILTAISTFAVAGGLFDAPWGGTPAPSMEQAPVSTAVSKPNEKSEPPLIFTKDINVLRGKGSFYSEGGALYKEQINADGTLATTSKNVATGAIRLIDQNEIAVLFVKDLVVPIATEGLSDYKNELWLLDKSTGATRKLFDNVTQEGSISPVGNSVVIRTTGNHIVILSYNGEVIATFSNYGVSPTFSPRGDKIAYIRLKEAHPEPGTPDMFQGVAVYDVATGTDSLILKTTPDGNEWMIAGWSADGKRIYFPSIDSTWSVGVDGTAKRQETNKTAGTPRVPMFLSHLLFTSDGSVAFGEAEGLWAFGVGKSGEFLDAKKVVEGTPGYSSRLDWVQKDKSVSSHLYGHATTTVYRISDLNR